LRATFPSSELFRCLPQAEELLQGVLSANLIGLQTHSYARHFTSCCTRILGLESTGLQVEADVGPVKLCIVPTGNAPERVSAAMQSTQVQEKSASFLNLYSGKRVILSIERVNQVSAAKHALRAFRFLLSKYSEIANVILVLVILPEEDTDELSESRRFILEEANRINSLFGTIEQSPVQLHFQNLELEEYYALLAVADIFLVANERDSLSNIPLDYIVCQEQKMGPLILSEFTALASSISTATTLVNPWDYVDLADKMKAALGTPIEERTSDYQKLLRYVKNNSEAHWVRKFLLKLDSCKEVMHRYGPKSYILSATVKEAYDKCTDRYLFLDYDGTLAPIVSVPSAAEPGPTAMDSLRRLCSNPRNHVYIISGRDRSILDAWLGDIKGLGISAEHGCFLKYAGSEEWMNLCPIGNEEWQTEVLRIFDYFTVRTPGSFIERKSVAITWHYRQADPEFGVSQAKQCQTLLEQMVCGKCPVEVIVGKKNLEVRPQAINKGGVLRIILSDLVNAAASEALFIFCAGDDRTDEDMFKFLQGFPSETVFTCAIGPASKRTAAKFHVNNPDQLLHLLYNLTE
jgi:trehalose-phosphatase